MPGELNPMPRSLPIDRMLTAPSRRTPGGLPFRQRTTTITTTTQRQGRHGE